MNNVHTRLLGGTAGQLLGTDHIQLELSFRNDERQLEIAV